MNHQNVRFRILAECPNGYIGAHECFDEFNFAYKTILLHLGGYELQHFFEWLIANHTSAEYHVPLPHGRDKVFASPNSNLYLTFNDEELDEIIQLYNNTVIALRAQTLFHNRMN
jgi:hypothetical protein